MYRFTSAVVCRQLETQVFEGVDMVNTDKCIIKVLKPVAAKKIKREIKILRNLTGGPNIVALLDVCDIRSHLL